MPRNIQQKKFIQIVVATRNNKLDGAQTATITPTTTKKGWHCFKFKILSVYYKQILPQRRVQKKRANSFVIYIRFFFVVLWIRFHWTVTNELQFGCYLLLLFFFVLLWTIIHNETVERTIRIIRLGSSSNIQKQNGDCNRPSCTWVPSTHSWIIINSIRLCLITD